MSFQLKVFQHHVHVNSKTGAAIETGDPIQLTETAKQIYHEIFEALRNPADWRLSTQRVDVQSWTEAQLVAEALTYLLGGAEVHAKWLGCYTVGSKGYYQYLKK